MSQKSPRFVVVRVCLAAVICGLSFTFVFTKTRAAEFPFIELASQFFSLPGVADGRDNAGGSITDDAVAVSNGPIVFQRGFLAGFDFPFFRGGKLYKVDPSSGTETLFGDGSQPNYSADGSKIVFTLNSQIARTPASTYVPTGLTILGGGSAITGFYPKWSPDSLNIAYNSSNLATNGTLYYYIFILGGSCSACDIFQQLNRGAAISNLYPGWSPTIGTVGASRTATIAYVQTPATRTDILNGTYSGDIVSEAISIAADGTVTDGVITNLTNSTAKYGFPTYSHDGTRIAYVKFNSDGSSSLFVMNANGSNKVVIINYPSGNSLAHHPNWSPDDNKLAFSDSNQIFQISPVAGQQPVAVTTLANSDNDLFPSWAPGTGNPTPTPSPTPPLAATLSFEGRLRDRVNRSDAGITPDGDVDGTFTLSLPPAAYTKSYKSIVLVGPNGNEWDTIPQQSPPLPLPEVKWVVGISDSLDGQLFNCSDGSLTCNPRQVGSPGVSKLFVPDSIPTSFVTGNTFSITVTFSDNTIATGSTTIGTIPTTDLGMYMRAENETGGPLGGSIAAGQPYRYHPQVTNYGPLSATGAIISVRLPQGVVFTRNDSHDPDACSQASPGSAVRCTITAAIAVGDTYGLIFYVQANQAGTFNATATVVSNQSEPIPDPHTNTFSVTTTTNSAADLSVSVSGDGDPVQVDAPLIYTATVRNNGPLDATNTQVRLTVDDLATYVQFSGTSPSCLRQGTSRQILCNVGTLSQGVQVTLKIQVRPKGVPNNADHAISLIADASSDLFDYDLTNSNIRLRTGVVPVGRPLNDNFLSEPDRPGSGPFPLAGLSGQLTGTNVGSTREVPINYGFNLSDSVELNHAGQNGGKSVWYYWTPPAGTTGGMSIDTSGSLFDTLLSVYAIDTTTLLIDTELVSNDNVAGAVTSAVSFNFDKKHVYYIVVDGRQGATGRFVLNWNAIVSKPAVHTVQQHISVGIFPSEICTASSNDPTLCPRDTSGNVLLAAKGDNFTNDSRVLITGLDLFGLYGAPITRLGSTELDQQIPPGFQLNDIGLASVRVVTKTASTQASVSDKTNFSPTGLFTPGLADGEYDIAYQSRGLNLFAVQNATVPPGGTQEVCVNQTGQSGSVCIEFKNGDPNNPAIITPTYFSRVKGCIGLTADRLDECLAFTRTNDRSFAFNTGSLKITTVKIKARLDLSPDTVAFIKSAGGKIAPVFEAGSLKPGTVGPNGPVITAGGGTLIGQDGNGLIGQDGNGLIGQDGNGLIGGGLISQDGNNVISHDGGTLIGQDGNGFLVKNGVISNDGGTRPDEAISAADSGLDNPSRPQVTSKPLVTGVGGLFLTKSSGGQEPDITITTDPVTGEVTGILTMTFDNTSFPRVSDIGRLAFTIAVNPAVISVASQNVTVNATDGNAAIKLKRNGNMTAPVTVDYSTIDGTATAGVDYTAATGRVTFAPNETEKTVNVALTNTSAVTPRRIFNLVIGNVFGGAVDAPNYTTVAKLGTISTISGKVLTSDGRGLRNATVSITDSNGVVRLATTSSFGFYSFDNVLTGGTYTIRISSRLFRFATRAVQVTDNISNVDFVGLE